MKRSNRLILLIGVFLAVVAFVGIVVIFGKNETPTGPAASPTTAVVVVAAQDIKLGDQITSLMVTTKQVATVDKPVDAFGDVGLVIGKIARVDVKSGAILTASGTFPTTGTLSAPAVSASLDKGLRAIAIRVDQVNGVGTIIQPGDRVDVIVAIKIQEMIPDTKNPGNIIPVPGGPQLSVKTVIQNVKVVGVLLPPPTVTPQQQNGQQPQPSAGTALTNQDEIVLVAVNANQAEIIRYAEAQAKADVTEAETAGPAQTIALTLRSPADASAPPDQTDGMTLKQLIDKYGVLPPLPFIGGPLR